MKHTVSQYNIEIARVVRIRLAELNMPKQELADKAGFTTARVTRICNGTADLDMGEVISLEMALGIPLIVIPDCLRVITISMDIDKSRGCATTDMNIRENGKPKTEWTIHELIATANVLQKKAQLLSEEALLKMTQEEKQMEEQK